MKRRGSSDWPAFQKRVKDNIKFAALDAGLRIAELGSFLMATKVGSRCPGAIYPLTSFEFSSGTFMLLASRRM